MKNLRVIVSLFVLFAFSHLAEAQFGKAIQGNMAERFSGYEAKSGSEYLSKGWRFGLDIDSGLDPDALDMSVMADAGYYSGVNLWSLPMSVYT